MTSRRLNPRRVAREGFPVMYDEMRGQVRGRGGERADMYSNTYRKNLKCIANCPGDGVLLLLFGENKTRRPQDKDGKITERRKYNIIEHSKRGPKNRRRQSSLRKKKAAFNLFFIQSLSAERERQLPLSSLRRCVR